MKHKKIGLALGGGGARGLAHIGVIRVLKEAGIVPDIIVGTSIGAIAGSLLATTGDPATVEEKVQAYFQCDCFKKIQFDLFREDQGKEHQGLFDALSHFVRKKIFLNVSLASQQSYVSYEDFMENMSILAEDMNIEDAKIPLGIVCTDLDSGSETVLTKGPLRLAIAASSAIPGIFPPIKFQGRTFIDGGWVNQLPISACRELGADIVIGVDVARELEQDFSLETGLDIIRRSNSITRYTLTKLQSRDCDILIEPEVGQMSWAGFDCIECCINLGERATRIRLNEIKQVVASKGSFLSTIFQRKT